MGRRESAPTAFEQESDGYWSLDDFEQEVVRPSLAGRGSIPWYGDGPALVRRSVLTRVDPSWRLPRDSRRMGLLAAGAGMETTFVPLTLARIPASTGLGDLLVRRAARLRGALRALRPGLLRRATRSTVFAHLLGLTPVLVALQRVLLIVASVLVLGFARVPVQAGVEFFALAVPAYGLRWVAQRVLGRGRVATFSILRGDIRSMATDLVPVRLSSRTAARLAVGAVGVSMIVLLGAVVTSGLALWWNWERDIPAETTAVALALTAVLVGVAMEELLEQLARRQRRNTNRVRLGLVTCRVEEHDGQLLDLSIGGVGVSLPCPPIDAPAPGSVTTISFRIPDADGAWRNVSALVHVAHRGADPEGGTRLGLAFDDPTDAPLDPVVEFLTIDRKLLAFGRRNPIP